MPNVELPRYLLQIRERVAHLGHTRVPKGRLETDLAAGSLGDLDTDQQVNNIRQALWGVQKGLEAIHERGIVHNDLRQPNVLFTRQKVVNDRGEEEDLFLGKLADFESKGSVNGEYSIAGTLSFMGPERLFALEQLGLRDDLEGSEREAFEDKMNQDPRFPQHPDPAHDLFSYGMMLLQAVDYPLWRDLLATNQKRVLAVNHRAGGTSDEEHREKLNEFRRQVESKALLSTTSPEKKEMLRTISKLLSPDPADGEKFRRLKSPSGHTSRALGTRYQWQSSALQA